jgi:hypothetical protein
MRAASNRHNHHLVPPHGIRINSRRALFISRPFICLLCRDKFPCHPEQILQCVWTNAGEPNEHGRVWPVVISKVIRVRIGGDEFLSGIEINADDDRTWFSGLVDGRTRQELSMNFQRWSSKCRALFDVRESESKFSNRVECDLHGTPVGAVYDRAQS